MSINPSDMPPSSNPATPGAGKAPANQPPQIPIATNWDPTGMWAKFLGGGGSPATPEEVQMFLNSLLRTIGMQLQEQEKQAAEAAKKLRQTIEGDDE